MNISPSSSILLLLSTPVYLQTWLFNSDPYLLTKKYTSFRQKTSFFCEFHLLLNNLSIDFILTRLVWLSQLSFLTPSHSYRTIQNTIVYTYDLFSDQLHSISLTNFQFLSPKVSIHLSLAKINHLRGLGYKISLSIQQTSSSPFFGRPYCSSPIHSFS